ncbi:MAG: hypothetical protein B7X32_08075 [Microbacterium sp. 13-71-7]|nr:MAG: hypothetical protein B7X32_08075 [Microbacterium sp. 13-71-7]
MSTDTLALIGSGLGGLLTLGVAMFAGFAWVIRRIDAVESKLASRIDSVEQRLDAKIDAVERNLSDFRTTVEHEFTDVKVAIARIEGPRPRLIVER